MSAAPNLIQDRIDRLTLVCNFLRSKQGSAGWVSDALCDITQEQGEAIISHVETGNAQALLSLVTEKLMGYAKQADEWKLEKDRMDRMWDRVAAYSNIDQASGMRKQGEL